jgi:hypothetical protein
MLVLFTTSGEWAAGKLMNPSVCPWRPPGGVLLERSSVKAIEMAHAKATIRLYYTQWQRRESPARQTPRSPVLGSASFDRMAETSGRVTLSLFGWLEDTRSSDADFNPEMEALREQIRVVDEDKECGGSDILSDENSVIHPASASFAGREFPDAEPVDSWDGDLKEISRGSSFGWCGLDAIYKSLQRGSSPISKDEAVRILAVTNTDVEQHGMSVNELEVFLNTR